MTDAGGSGGARILAGRCLCGAVCYEVKDAFNYALNCHCSDCRKATGTAFKAFAGIARSEMSVTRGGDRILIFGNADGDHDVRCKACGSFLYSVVRGGAAVHVALGSLVDPPSIRPRAHIFVADKAPWFEITDALPRFEGHVKSDG